MPNSLLKHLKNVGLLMQQRLLRASMVISSLIWCLYILYYGIGKTIGGGIVIITIEYQFARLGLHQADEQFLSA